MILPIALLVIVGGIQFGLAFNYWLDLNHVASEGARWASVNRLPSTSTLPSGSTSVTPTQIESYVESQVLSKGLLDSIQKANEIQTVALTGATGGSFTLRYGNQTTVATAWNASAATVDARLEALSTVGAGNVSVTGAVGGPWTVTFVGALANTNADPITVATNSLTPVGSTAVVHQTSDGSGGVEACFTKAPGNTLATPQPGDALSIEIQAPYRLGFGLVDWVADPLTLRGRSTMRIEQVPAGFTALDACT